MKEVILDTETTGLSVREGHRLIEIGCIELDNLIPTKKTFHVYLNPQRKVSEQALKVHGYTDEFLSDKKKFSEIINEFLNFIEGTTVNTKYGPIKTDHILFIASGAFQLAKPSDLLPELQGRLPIRVELEALTTVRLKYGYSEPIVP